MPRTPRHNRGAAERRPRPPRPVVRIGFLIVLALAVMATGCSGDESDQSEDTTTTQAPTTTTTIEPMLEEGTQKEPLYFVPEIGDCFDRRKVPGADNKQVDTILLLDCQLPHQYEIFATIAYPLPDDGDGAWPGDEAVRDFARSVCPGAFEAYVGKPYETSVFEIGHLLPPEDNFYANQVIGCSVYDPTKDTVVEGRSVPGRTAGTAQGSAR